MTDIPPGLRGLCATDANGDIDKAQLAAALKELASRDPAPEILILAGMAARWAWELLAADAAATRDRYADALPRAPPPDPFDEMERALVDAFYSDDDELARSLLNMPSIQYGVRFRGPRRVRPMPARRISLAELLQAFDAAQREAAENAQRIAVRDQARVDARLDRERRVRAAAPDDDPGRDMALVMARLPDAGVVRTLAEVSIARLPVDRVSALTAVLQLAKRGVVDVWQPDFPVGPVFVRRRA